MSRIGRQAREPLLIRRRLRNSCRDRAPYGSRGWIPTCPACLLYAPSPRPEIIGTVNPAGRDDRDERDRDLVTYATGRVLVDLWDRETCERSMTSPEWSIASVHAASSPGSRPTEQNRHQQGRHLIVGDVAAGVRRDHPMKLLGCSECRRRAWTPDDLNDAVLVGAHASSLRRSGRQYGGFREARSDRLAHRITTTRPSATLHTFGSEQLSLIRSHWPGTRRPAEVTISPPRQPRSTSQQVAYRPRRTRVPRFGGNLPVGDDLSPG